MLNLFLIAFGGAIGALSRYFVSQFSIYFFYKNLYGTFFVNVIGSFLIGYIISTSIFKNFSEEFVKYFLIIGVLGSFTTFSAFSNEVINLFISEKFFFSFLYIIFTITFCILAAYFGIYINKF